MAGLAAGLLLPSLAVGLRPFLPLLVACLLFLAAFRVGPDAILKGLRSDAYVLRLILVYQLVAPLVVLGVATLFGVMGTTAALAAVLVFSAPSVTGNPNFALLMKVKPDPALQMLMLGTVAFPFTVMPVLFFMPEIEVRSVLSAAARLIGVVVLAGGAAFILRSGKRRVLSVSQEQTVDGASAILLGIVVIGLMSAVGPMISLSPLTFLMWLSFATVVNFGAQLLSWNTVAPFVPPADGAAISIVAGNRNIALFLIALPPDFMGDLLSFIGCYQFPMYLTPFLFARVYRPQNPAA